jgi:hypothetical protein
VHLKHGAGDRIILKIKWTDRITKEVLQRANEER